MLQHKSKKKRGNNKKTKGKHKNYNEFINRQFFFWFFKAVKAKDFPYIIKKKLDSLVRSQTNSNFADFKRKRKISYHFNR